MMFEIISIVEIEFESGNFRVRCKTVVHARRPRPPARTLRVRPGDELPALACGHTRTRADLAAARCNLREARDGAAMRLRAVPGERPAARTWVWVPAVT